MYVSRDDRDVVKDLIQLQKRVIASNVWQCCLNCEHWAPNSHDKVAQAPGCTRWNTMPPPEVLTVGCPSWESVIPF